MFIINKYTCRIFTLSLHVRFSFVSLLSSKTNKLEITKKSHPNGPGTHFDPFIAQISLDDINGATVNNCQRKTLFSFNTDSQIVDANNNSQKAFASNPTKHALRNAPYRFHKKLSTEHSQYFHLHFTEHSYLNRSLDLPLRFHVLHAGSILKKLNNSNSLFLKCIAS